MKKFLITIKESIFNRVTFKTIVAATFLIIIGAVLTIPCFLKTSQIQYIGQL